jgi:D-beta-D-heptose 7-phosphate kinase/D-beta-D-heptose 1-phosphate adenosyltransferase
MSNKKVVFTNGCFDLLHVGHVRYLVAAKNYGDWLIVGLNSDESFRRHKGRNPINDEQSRYEVLDALECVDEVRIFSEDTPERLLSEICPDVLVKGPDYSPDEVLGREYAKQTFCLEVGSQTHTSDIIDKIRQVFCPSG